MTPRPRAPRDEDPAVAAVATLYRDLDGLRHRVDGLGALVGKVDDLATAVQNLSASLAPGPTTPKVIPSWLMPPDVDRAAAILRELGAWVTRVYLRFPDAAQALPECWVWHPDVVEELLWLHLAWHAAHHGPTATVLAVGDWHDRARPGVVRRTRGAAGTCSAENHPSAGDRHTPAPHTPMADVVTTVAAFWVAAVAEAHA